MAKASSPVRLQAELMTSASLAGVLNKRSAAEQVEYWASIGQCVAEQITPADLLELKAGLLSISLVKHSPVDIEPSDLLAEVDVARQSAALSKSIQAGGPRYQAAKDMPGCLERIHPDGMIEIGRFVDGEFKVLE